MQLEPGATICDRFELIREQELGFGCPLFGPAWAALDNTTGEVVLLNLLASGLFSGTDAAERAASRVAGYSDLCVAGDEHALLPVVFAGIEPRTGHLVVAYEPLFGALSLDDFGGPRAAISAERFQELGRFVQFAARGLARLHERGLVHGAMDTTSTFIWEGGQALWQYGLVSLCDRGALLIAERRSHVRVLPPERTSGATLTPASDVFGWGAVVATVASGAPRRQAIELGRAREIPALGTGALRDLVEACLAEEPGGRPADGAELLGLLTEGILDGELDELIVEAIDLAERGVLTVPTMSMSTMPSASMSLAEAALSGSLPPMPEAGSLPPLPEAGSLPEFPEAGSLPEFPEAGSLPPMPEAGSLPEFPEAGSLPPMPEAGSLPDLPEAGSLPDLPEAGSMPPRSPAKAAKPGRVRVLRRNLGEAPADSNILPPPPPEFNEGAAREEPEVDLSVRVASAVGNATSSGEGSGLQDGVTAALASALSTPPEPEPDAPTRRSARMTNPLGVAAITDEHISAESLRARTPEPEDAAAESSSKLTPGPAERSGETPVRKPKKPESAVDRYVNMAIAVVGGLVLAWLLLTWLTR
ncbi:MAG: hypothetical protein H6713_22555 [Myxococcales bacterium]|nr:hypothetical protein [Myxococcales bacterium]